MRFIQNLIKTSVYHALIEKVLAYKKFVNDQIFGVYSFAGKYKVCSIFGYASKGLPGLEIAGLDKRARVIKEKLVYIGRHYGVRVPIRRYVLCVEDFCSESKESRWLELPLLILYWKLAGILPIKKLENCFCGGKISVTGGVQVIPLDEPYLDAFDLELARKEKKLNYLSSELIKERKNIRLIPLKGLFGEQLQIK